MYDTFYILLAQSCSALGLVAGGIWQSRSRKNRAAGTSKARNRINLRVSEAEYDQLVREAAGKTTISAVVHRRLFGAGMRNHDVLRQVAALHQLGMEVRALTNNPAARALDVQATLAKVQVAIRELAKQLP